MFYYSPVKDRRNSDFPLLPNIYGVGPIEGPPHYVQGEPFMLLKLICFLLECSHTSHVIAPLFSQEKKKTFDG